MPTLSIASSHLETIRTHAVETYPEECCGVLLGLVNIAEGKTTRTVVDLWPVANTWGDEAQTAMQTINSDTSGQHLTAERRYWIDPKDLLAAQKAARKRDLQIIGIYHSHPDHPALPSESDRALAWSDYSYIIVSVPRGKATEVLSWSLNEHNQFQSETVMVVT